MIRIAAAALSVVALSGCGYHLVRIELPEAAGGCVHIGRLDGGEAYPKVAKWTAQALRTRLAPDVCAPGEEGAVLEGTVSWVRQDQALQTVDSMGAVQAGAVWVAAAQIWLVQDGATVWGPEGVEVSREFLSTGDPVAELDALDAHLKLLSESLALSLSDRLYQSR